MTEANRPWLSERLRHSLQLLACPAETQLKKFPPFVHAPDEMALDFDNFRSAFVGNFRTEMTSEQLHYLELIDTSFGRMDKNCFSADGINNSKEWRRIRELASQALGAFGWPSMTRLDATLNLFPNKLGLLSTRLSGFRVYQALRPISWW